MKNAAGTAIFNRMVESSTLDRTFFALADPTRRALLVRLAQGASSVSSLAEPFEMSLAAVAKHLRMLEEAGLVSTEKRGRTRHCRLVTDPLTVADAWIVRCQHFWEVQFDALAEHLDETSEAS